VLWELPALNEAGADRERISAIVEADAELQIDLQAFVNPVSDAAIDAVKRGFPFFEPPEVRSEQSDIGQRIFSSDRRLYDIQTLAVFLRIFEVECAIRLET
jgi:hypothetical protein